MANSQKSEASDLQEGVVPYGLQRQAAMAFADGLLGLKAQSDASQYPNEIVDNALIQYFAALRTPNIVQFRRLGKMLRLLGQLSINYNPDLIPKKFNSAIFESKEIPVAVKRTKNIALNIINEVSQATWLPLNPVPEVTAYFQYLIKKDPVQGFEVLDGHKHIAYARSIPDAKKLIDSYLSRDAKLFGLNGTGFNSVKEGKTKPSKVDEGWGPLNNFLIGLGPLAGIIQSLERPSFSELMSALKKYPGFLVKSAVEDLKTWWNDPKVIIEYLGSASDTEFYRIRNTGKIPYGDYVVASPSGSGKPNSRNVGKLKILCDFDKWEKFKSKNF